MIILHKTSSSNRLKVILFLEVWRKILIEGIIGKFKRMEGRGGEGNNYMFPLLECFTYWNVLKIKGRGTSISPLFGYFKN